MQMLSTAEQAGVDRLSLQWLLRNGSGLQVPQSWLLGPDQTCHVDCADAVSVLFPNVRPYLGPAWLLSWSPLAFELVWIAQLSAETDCVP
jgi:hypothetical protein